MANIIPVEAYYTYYHYKVQQLLLYHPDDEHDRHREINGHIWEPGLVSLYVAYPMNPDHQWNPKFCVIFKDYADDDQQKVAWAKEKNLSLLAFGLCRVIDEEQDGFKAVYLFTKQADALLFKLRWNV